VSTIASTSPLSFEDLVHASSRVALPTTANAGKRDLARCANAKLSFDALANQLRNRYASSARFAIDGPGQFVG
jgi:hypothetical protein